MNITIVIDAVLPAMLYGGTERVAYSLGRALADLGHRVTFLARKGSRCDFARIVELDSTRPPYEQIPAGTNIVHYNNVAGGDSPYVVTIHGNMAPGTPVDPYSIFVSADHARRHGCDSYVYNGLDFSLYPAPDLSLPRQGFHFLGKAAWKVKNVRGAIDTAVLMRKRIDILGGVRFNFSMGWRFTLTPRAHFHGMVGNDTKAAVMQRSEGLIFPVRWNEPFGLAVIESLYYGAPVFATPYGSLPELVTEDTGRLASSARALADAIESSSFDPAACHRRALDFSAEAMARAYVEKYTRVLDGEVLAPGAVVPYAAPLPLAWE